MNKFIFFFIFLNLLYSNNDYRSISIIINNTNNSSFHPEGSKTIIENKKIFNEKDNSDDKNYYGDVFSKKNILIVFLIVFIYHINFFNFSSLFKMVLLCKNNIYKIFKG